MRRLMFLLLLALLTLTVACKRTDPQPAAKKAPAIAQGTVQPTPEAPQQPPQAQAANETAPSEGPSTRPPPPSLSAEELLPDDPSCVAKIDREEQEFRRDKLPRLIEEEQAVSVLDAWLDSTAKTLQAGESSRLMSLLEDGRKELNTCRKDIEPRLYEYLTMMSLPADPNSPRLPHFFCEGSLPKEVEWCSTIVLRMGQWDLLDALWTDGAFAARFCDDSSVKKGNRKRSPEASGLTKLVVCQALLQSDDCSATGLTAAAAAIQAETVTYCQAVQAGLKGAPCGGTFGPGTAACKLAGIVKAEKGSDGCKELAKSSGKIIPDVFCRTPKAFAEVDCGSLAASSLSKHFRKLESKSCELARLARTHTDGCGTLSETSSHCNLYEAYRASLLKHSDNKRLKLRGQSIFLSRAWARTLLHAPEVRLASMVIAPGQLGAPPGAEFFESITPEDLAKDSPLFDGRPPPPGKGTPPDGKGQPQDGTWRPADAAGPDQKSLTLLPDLWAEARGKNDLDGPPMQFGGSQGFGGNQGQGPSQGGQQHGPPPSGGMQQGAPPTGGMQQGAPPTGGMQQGAPPTGGMQQGAPPTGGQQQGAPPTGGQQPGDVAKGPPVHIGTPSIVAPPDQWPTKGVRWELPKAGQAPTGDPPPRPPGESGNIGPLGEKLPEGDGALRPPDGAGQNGLSAPFPDGKQSEGPEGEPGEKPEPVGGGTASRLVTGEYVDPLTTTGGPIQQAMTSFTLGTLKVPGDFSDRGQVPCAPYRKEQKMFPASDGGIMASVRILNVSQRPLRCEFRLTVAGADGKSDKTRQTVVRVGEVEVVSVRFENQAEAKLSIHEACVQVAEEPQESEAATK